MAVKTISLSEEAYAKLEAERAEGESFERNLSLRKKGLSKKHKRQTPNTEI
jgi:predicted CopG family antitoxin